MAKDTQWITVTVVFGMGAIAMSLLQPVLPLYLDSLSISPEMIGLMFSTSMVAMAIGEGFWGWVADKIGVWGPLLVGTLICGLVVLLYPLAATVVTLFIVFFFWGLFRSAIFGPCRGFLAAGAPAAKKATRLAVVAATLAASHSVGAFPSGYIVDSFGYPSVFMVSAAISFAGALLVLPGLLRTRFNKTFEYEKSDTQQYPKLNSLAWQRTITFFNFFNMGLMIAFLPLLATEATGATAAMVGILVSIRGLTSMFFSIPLGNLADRFGNHMMMLMGLIITAGAMSGFALAKSYMWFVIVIIIYSIGHSAFSPAAQSLFSITAPLQRQGTTMGFYGAICENSGIIAGSAMGGFFWSAWGGTVTFMLGALSSLVGAILFSLLIKYKPDKVCARS